MTHVFCRRGGQQQHEELLLRRVAALLQRLEQHGQERVRAHRLAPVQVAEDREPHDALHMTNKARAVRLANVTTRFVVLRVRVSCAFSTHLRAREQVVLEQDAHRAADFEVVVLRVRLEERARHELQRLVVFLDDPTGAQTHTHSASSPAAAPFSRLGATYIEYGEQRAQLAGLQHRVLTIDRPHLRVGVSSGGESSVAL